MLCCWVPCCVFLLTIRCDCCRAAARLVCLTPSTSCGMARWSIILGRLDNMASSRAFHRLCNSPSIVVDASCFILETHSFQMQQDKESHGSFLLECACWCSCTAFYLPSLGCLIARLLQKMFSLVYVISIVWSIDNLPWCQALHHF